MQMLVYAIGGLYGYRRCSKGLMEFMVMIHLVVVFFLRLLASALPSSVFFRCRLPVASSSKLY